MDIGALIHYITDSSGDLFLKYVKITCYLTRLEGSLLVWTHMTLFALVDWYLTCSYCNVWPGWINISFYWATYSIKRISFLFSLMLALVSTAKEVRAAGLRAFRHLFFDEKTLSKMLDFRIDVFVVRFSRIKKIVSVVN